MQRKNLRFGKGFRVHFGTPHSQGVEMVLEPGQSEGNAQNNHQGSDQWLFVVAGEGIARINGKPYLLKTGSLFLIEKGDIHEIRNNGNTLLRTLNIYVPPAYRKDGTPLPSGRSTGGSL